MSEKQFGPIYGVELLVSLPLDGGGMSQALPSRKDLDDVRRTKINGNDRVVAGYEVLLEHYRRVLADNAELAKQLTAARETNKRLNRRVQAFESAAAQNHWYLAGLSEGKSRVQQTIADEVARQTKQANCIASRHGEKNKRLNAENGKLRERLQQQSLATQEAAGRVRDAVIAALRADNALPENLDPHGHPVEQTVSAIVGSLKAEIARLRGMIDQTADGALVPDCENMYCPRCGGELRLTYDIAYCDSCPNPDDGCSPNRPPLALLFGLCYSTRQALEAARKESRHES